MSDYGPLAKLLHKLALSGKAVSEATFDIEQRIVGRHLSEHQDGRHVFVSGLARSGTTVLMRAIYDTGLFASLTYRDMPFVLMPNTWGKYSRHGAKVKDATDRAHADGVKVGYDSPEALEEVFWRIFHGDEYIKKDRLVTMRTGPEDRLRFKKYVETIMQRYGSTRYLSKNNNNILRLGTISSTFPMATILVPYREPEQQAYSLLKQHRHFSKMHETDSFSRSYMGWLVHHEFGSDHRPFNLVKESSENLNTLSLDYWVAQWIGVYGYVLATLEKRPTTIQPVGYEILCDDTESVWSGISHMLDLGNPQTPDLSARKCQVPLLDNRNLLDTANGIYEKLNAACLQGISESIDNRKHEES